MNKEEITFNTNEDIIMQIEMMSYMEYNDEIATANDYIGDVYSYRDIEEMEQAQLHYEKELSYKAIKQLQQENKQLKESISELSQYKYDREEQDKMDWLIGQEEEFNDYSFMEE